MNLTVLELKNFKKFPTLALHFTPGINVIRGNNEAGKSTIVAALIAGLFYDPTKAKAAQEIERLRRWGSDELYSISLGFTEDNQNYSVRKDFHKKELLLRGPGVHSDTWPEVRDAIANFTGFSTPTLYAASAAIPQDKVAAIHSKKSELAKVLQGLVTAGSEETSALTVINAVQRKINQLKRGLKTPVDDPGPLKQVKDEYEEKTRLYQEKRERQQLRVAKRKELHKIETTLAQLEELIATQGAELEAGQAVLDAQKSLEQDRTVFAQLETQEHERTALQQQLGAIDAQLATFTDWQRIDVAAVAQKLTELGATIRILEQTLSAHTAAESFPRRRLTWVYGIGAALSAVVGIGGFFGPHVLWAVFVLTAIFIVLLFTEVYSKRPHTIPVSGREQNQEKQLTQLRQSQRALLEKLKITDAAQFASQRALYEKLQRDREKISIRLEEKKSDPNSEGRRTELAASILANKERVATLAVDQESLRGLRSLEKKLAAHRAQREQLLLQQAAARGVLESIPRDEDLSVLEEEILLLHNTFKKLKREQEALQIVLTTLQEAQARTLHSVQSVLEAEVQRYLPLVTQGRYRKVSVSPELNITVTVPGVEAALDPKEHLSRGTIDQIYLVTRFALVKAMSENKRPPVILDDPFVTFDEARKEGTMQLLQELGKHFQILLFTYDSWYDRFANNVITLPQHD